MLGVGWKENKNLRDLGGLRAKLSKGCTYLEGNRDLDGGGGVDLKAASSTYFVETRVRVQGVLVCPLPLCSFKTE
jgi:carbon catabolite-derepressing protein kinase